MCRHAPVRTRSACRRIASYLLAASLVLGGWIAPSHALIARAAGPQAITQQVIGTQDTVTPTNPFTTTAPNELLVVFVSVNGDNATGETDTLTGGGVTWTNAVRANSQFGMASIWWAVESGIVTNQVLTSTRSKNGGRGGIITIQGFLGADTVAPIGASSVASGTVAAESTSLTTTRNNGWVWGVGADWVTNAARAVGGGQTIVDQQFNVTQGNTFWDQKQNFATPGLGAVVKINDTGPAGDRWNLASVEIRSPVPGTSPVTPDIHVSTLADDSGTYITSPPISTAAANQVLTAFITNRGPPPGGDPITGVTGGGLTWTQATGTSAEGDGAYVWYAVAATPVTNIQVVASHGANNSAGFIVVDAWVGVDPVTPFGATTSLALPNGTVTGSVTTTRANSWVWAVGGDYDGSNARTIGANQAMAYQQLDPWGDTYWLQHQNATTPSSGTVVTMNDTAPIGDRVDFAIVELLAASSAPGVYDWGMNTNGQAANGGTASPVTTPFAVSGFGAVDQVSGGHRDTYVLKPDGSVWNWGQNDLGELGQGSVSGGGCTCITAPVQVKDSTGASTLSGIRAIAASGYGGMALTTAGTAWAWGYNGSGQLGNGNTTDQKLPVKVQQVGGGGQLSNVTAIAAGWYDAMALAGGTVYTWGDNTYGELGIGTSGAGGQSTPVVVKTNSTTNLASVTAIAAGQYGDYALRSDGTVWAWGRDQYGQLGDGVAGTTSTYAIQVPTISGAKAIAAGYAHASVIEGASNNVWAWGYDSNGALGQGSTSGATCVCRAPVEARDHPGTGFLANISTIADGGWHSLAISTAGNLWGWGSNADGELGDGGTTDQLRPEQNPTMSGVTWVAGLGYGSVAGAGLPPPSVTGISPGSGTPGSVVQILGDNFTAAATVAFGGTAAGGVTFVSPQTLTATAPAGAGTVDVIVTTTAGTSATSPSDHFTYSTSPTTTAVTASANPSVSGQSVTYTATVTGAAPTGTVTFKDGAVTLGTGALGGGVATYSTGGLAGGSHSITAVYSGDSNNSGSTSSVLTQTVNQAATTTVVTSPGNPSVTGQTATYTATVTATAPGSGTPTGTATFKDGGVNIAGCVNVAMAGGVATCAQTYAAVGSHPITAVYSADANYNASTSAALTQTVNQDATTTTVASSANPSGTGQAVTYTATVSANAPGGGTPTGTVTFKDGGVAIGTCTGVALGGGSAACGQTYAATGVHSITVVYSGDGNYTASTSAALTQTVSQAATTTVVASSVNPSVSGQPVTFTATVTANAPGGGTPAGTVTFKDGGVSIGTCTNVAMAGGTATCAQTYAAAGSHAITAVYSGDGNYLTSTSAGLTQTITKAATTTVVASSVNPSVSGQSATYTATVSATAPGSGVPSGTVTFQDGGVSIGLCTNVALAGGTASCAVTYAAAGSHPITAVYSSDANYTASTSAGLTQIVNKAATSAALTSSANPSVSGQAVTYTATVMATAPGSGTATGTVTFKDGGVSIGACTNVALAGGIAACVQTYTASGGSHGMTAVYSGDANFSTSTSATLTQTVTKDATTTAVGSSVNPSSAGQAVTFTATVTANAPGGGTPAGAVTFQDGGVNIAGCVGLTLVGGAITCGQTYPTVGSHGITAIYAGDPNSTTSTSSTLTQTVTATATATTVASSVNPSVFGQAVTYTATVTGATPTGTVTFKDGSTTLGTGAVNGSFQATFSTSALSVAGSAHSITAVYGGDGNNGGSASSVVAQVVTKDATSVALSSSSNPSVAGQVVTYTATVSVTAPGGGSPTGTVTFQDGGVAIGTCTTVALSGTAATCVQTYASVGSHPVTAVYAGDGNENGSTSSVVTQTIIQAATTTAVTSSANPSVSGQAVTYTATVVANAPGSGTPADGDAVTFKDGAATICATTLSGGTATCAQTYAASGGGHSITVVIAGVGNYAASTSSPLTQTVAKDATATGVSSSVNPSSAGQPTTYTATVTATAPGGGTPAATVSFRDGGVNIAGCVNVVLSSGSASCSQTYAIVGAGTHAITVLYGGDGNFAGSTSTTLTQTITMAATTTTLTSSVNPSVTGQSVTVTATVTGAAPTGTVTFKDGAATIGSAPLTGGFQATFATSSLGVAGSPHSITAVYGGDANNTGSPSGPVAQTVNKDGTAATVTSSVDPSVTGQAVTYTATVTANVPGGGTPTGMVTFQDGGADIGGVCSPAALTSGSATCVQTYGGAGGHSITAIYSGDGGFTVSASPVLNQVVNPGVALVQGGPGVTSASGCVTLTLTSPSTAGDLLVASLSADSNGAFSATAEPGWVRAGGVANGPTAASEIWYFPNAPAGISSQQFCSVGATAMDGDMTEWSGADQVFPLDVTGTVAINGATTATATTSAPTLVNGEVGITSFTVNQAGGGVQTFTPGAGWTNLSSDGTATAFHATHDYETTLPQQSVAEAQTLSASADWAGIVATFKPLLASSTTALSSSVNPSVAGQAVTYTATVTGGGPTPSGTVTFADSGTAIAGCGSVALDGTATATCAPTYGAAGVHAITAQYGGDGNDAASVSATVTQTVNQTGSATTVTSTHNPSAYGDGVTFVATVTGAGDVPTGTATFMDGAATLGSGALDGSGTATYTTSTLIAATHAITVVYGADANHTGSTSGVLSQVVNPGATSTVLTADVNPSTYSQVVTYTAAVTGNGAAGTVTFFDGATSLGSDVVSGGTAQLAVATLTAGAHSITALYSGDPNNAGSTSNAVLQAVNQAATATVLTSSVNPSGFGQAVTFTAAVSGAGGVADGSTVTVMDGAGVLGTTTTTGGSATVTTAALGVASHTITAVFAGDAGHSGDTSNPVTQVVAVENTSTAVTTSGSPSTFPGPSTFTATVSGGSVTPTGTVTFTDSASSTTATVAVDGSGQAQWTVATLDAGGHTISATYSGDAGDTSSAGSVVQSVVQAASSTAVTTSLSPSLYAQNVTFTATVSAAGGIPDGAAVSFSYGGGPLGSGTTTAGVATLTTSALPVGAGHTVTAGFAGDTDRSGSSGTVTQTVTQASSSTAVTTSQTSSLYGDSVTYTATVTGAGGIPDGRTVTFTDGALTLGTATTASGIAVITTTALPVGAAQTVTASYPGDPGHTGSTGTVAQDVARAGSGTDVVTSQTPSVYGGTVTFTATVTVTGVGGIPDGGSVSFDDGAQHLGTSPTTSGVATVTTTALPVGAGQNIIATYAGDTDHSGSSDAMSQDVTLAVPAGGITSSGSPSVYAGTVTFTVTVSAPGAGAVPTGTVDVTDGATALCTGAALSGGAATCATAALGAAAHTITATYSGDGNYAAAAPLASVAQTVGRAGSTTALASSVTPAGTAQIITFTATVSGPGAAPAGTVTFDDAGAAIGSGVLSGGVATYSTTLPAGTHDITAVYPGDGNHTGSSSGILTQSVTAAAAVITAPSSDLNPSVVGQTVTLGTTVSGAGAPPTGTVDFDAAGSPIAGCTGIALAGGGASCATTILAAPSDAITAVYSGDGTYGGGTSPATTQVVNQSAASIAQPSSSLNPSTYGDSVSFSTTVAGGGPVPTGTVDFEAGGTTIPGCGAQPLDGGGTAVCSTGAGLGGSHAITAVYSGDADYTTVASAPLTQSVNPVATVPAITSGGPSAFGQTVTFTVHVPGAGVVPTGTADLFDGITPLGSGGLDGAGDATFSTNALIAGTHPVTATYTGDGNYAAGTTSVYNQVVNAGLATVAPPVSSNPSSTYGTAVTFSTTVTGTLTTPTGTVAFRDGGVVVSGCGAAVLDGAGDASCATGTLLDAGSHPITAVYSGDGNYGATASSALDQQVAPGATATALAASGSPSTYPDTVTITATVTGTGAVPTGTVTFTDSNSILTATLALDGAGHARWSIAALDVTTHHLSAAYAGDTDNHPSTSAVLAQTIAATGSATTVGSSANPSTFGRMVTFTATVTGAGTTPAGTVTFSDAGTPLAPASVLNGSGDATYSLATLGTGDHDITAEYSGDGNHDGSGSAPLAQTVGRVTTTTAVRSSANPSPGGQLVTFTATVAGSAPTGTVVFEDGGTPLGAGTLSARFQATFTAVALSVAGSPHRITAVYGGDGDNGGSTSAAQSQTVTTVIPEAGTPTPPVPSPSASPAGATGGAPSPTPSVRAPTTPPSGTHFGQDSPSSAGSGFFGLAAAVGAFATAIRQHWLLAVFATIGLLVLLLGSGILLLVVGRRRRRTKRRTSALLRQFQ